MGTNPLEWRKSTFSADGNGCVEIAEGDDGGRLVRDTKARGQGPILAFTPAEWDAFVRAVKAGEFD